MVVPILLYGSEVWGIKKIQIIKQSQLRFCKLILNLKPATPNRMIYGETGIFAPEIQVKFKILNYWIKSVCSKIIKCVVL